MNDDHDRRYDPTGPLDGGLRALEASAGTGKTFAITSTVLRLVVQRDQPFPMDRLLLVTFTRAATAELEDRVRRRLLGGERALAAAAGDPDWVPDDAVLRHVVAHARAHGLEHARRRVEEALRTVDQATVTTIHGFCHQVLQRAAVHADSDPGVVIDTDDDRLVAAVVDDWLVRVTHDADQDLIELLDRCGLTRTNVHAIGRVVAGEPDPVLAPDLWADQLDPTAEIAAARERLRAALNDPSDTLAASQRLYDAGVITGHSTWSPTPGKMPKRLGHLRAALAEDRVTRDVLKFLDPLGTDGDGSKPMPDEIAATSVPRAVDGLRTTRARVETWFRRRLASDVRSELRRRREQAGSASFADLLRQLADALDGPGGDALVAEIGGQVDAVLVDEFQDTDPVQWSILRRLFAGVQVFHVVGDPKQAIYGWRGADLRTYLRALDDADDTRTMTTNWRSDRALVTAVNHLLGDPDSLGGGGVRYVEVDAAHDDARLRDDTGGDGAGLHLTYLPGLAELPVGIVRAQIAAAVAEDVVRTLGAGLTLPVDPERDRGTGDRDDRDGGAGDGSRRPVATGDCAVLVRRHSEAAAVAAALDQRGVPNVVGGGDDVLLSRESEAMADLLRVLTSPGDDRALRRLLVGPFVGLDGDELAALDDDHERWQQHAVAVRRWASTWTDHGIAAAVQRAIREGEAERRHARRRDGDRTMTNLRHLTELLHVAEQDEALGTHALAAWFDARRGEAAEEMTPPERELRLERDEDAVQVMTIHAAKGLEFGLVWVPFLWTSDVRDDSVHPFVVNDPAQDHVRTVVLHAASSRSVRERDPERVRLRAVHDRAEWEGSMRLAYVALTRARHRCTIHLCGYDHHGSLTESPAWQLLWRSLGTGAPGEDRPTYDEDQLRHLLREQADHPSITLTEHPDPPAVTMLEEPLDAHADQLEALRWGREGPLDIAWGRASFTGLLRHRSAPAAAEADAQDEADLDQAADRHAHGLTPLPPATFEHERPVPLASLPRGAAWGTFLHDVLEHAAFDLSPRALRELVEDRAAGASVRPDGDQTQVVTDGLHAALVTPLGPELDELRLCDVADDDRLDELGFTLTVGDDGGAAGVTVAALARLFEHHATASDAPLSAAAAHLRSGGSGAPVHGLLVGSIDLVLRHRPDGDDESDDVGRFWIADYKSNGLGQWVEDPGGTRRWAETPAHTSPDRVMAAMIAGDYLLQAHLYVVALHRYLRARLGGRYDYDRHVGGWAYLFLRGMTGPSVRRDRRGVPHGVAVGRPTRELVEDLDALLRGTAGAP